MIKPNKIFLLLLIIVSSFAIAEPELYYSKVLAKQLKKQPCTNENLPLSKEIQVKEAIECDYKGMEVIKMDFEDKNEKIVTVKLYAKGEMKHIIVDFETGLTIDPEDK
ncbi:hypothetical protein [Marinicellulosiphila megalodicopiae]|uniref:hypothetical protein n=1 Tax=Marinicellulosiphila megalodicopiae TaxID=2724896 RepID=UPI003BB06E67